MSVLELYTQLFARNWSGGRFAQSLSLGCSEKSRKTLSWQQGDGRADKFRSRSSWFSGDLRWKLDLLLRPRDRVPRERTLALPDPRRPDRANPPTNFWWSLFFDSTGFPLNRQPTRNIMLRFYGSSGSDSVGRAQHSSNRVCGISTRTIHQSTTPSLSRTIWPRREQRKFLTLPIVQTLLPVTFGYSQSSEAVVMRELRRWKRLWRRSLTCSHKRNSMGRSRSCWNGTTSALQPEEITSKRLLEFYVCTINKSAHTKKSLETYRVHLVYMCVNELITQNGANWVLFMTKIRYSKNEFKQSLRAGDKVSRARWGIHCSKSYIFFLMVTLFPVWQNATIFLFPFLT